MISTLPPEVITIILSHIPDKTNASMVCKQFQNLLLDMFNRNMFSDINDSYYLNKHLIKNGRYRNFIDNKIRKIQNYNSLNCIMHICNRYFNKMSRYTLQKVLEQHLKMNHKGNPKYMLKLISYSSSYEEPESIDIFVKYKASDLLTLVILAHPKVIGYISIALLKNYINDTSIINIKNDIDYLVSKQAITYTQIYIQFRYVYLSVFVSKVYTYSNHQLVKDLYAHFKQYISDDIKQYMKNIEI